MCFSLPVTSGFFTNRSAAREEAVLEIVQSSFVLAQKAGHDGLFRILTVTVQIHRDRLFLQLQNWGQVANVSDFLKGRNWWTGHKKKGKKPPRCVMALTKSLHLLQQTAVLGFNLKMFLRYWNEIFFPKHLSEISKSWLKREITDLSQSWINRYKNKTPPF